MGMKTSSAHGHASKSTEHSPKNPVSVLATPDTKPSTPAPPVVEPTPEIPAEPVVDGDFKNHEQIERNISGGVNDLKAPNPPEVAELLEIGNRIEQDSKTLRDRLAQLTQAGVLELGEARRQALEKIAGLSDRSRYGSAAAHVPGTPVVEDKPPVVS